MFMFIRHLGYGLSLLIVSIVSTPSSAQQARDIEQDNPEIRVEQVASDLGVTWGMAFLAPDRLLLTERSGTVRLLNLKNGSSVSLSGAPEVVAVTMPDPDAKR